MKILEKVAEDIWLQIYKKMKGGQKQIPINSTNQSDFNYIDKKKMHCLHNHRILQKFSNFKFSNKFLPNVNSKLILNNSEFFSSPTTPQFLLYKEVSSSDFFHNFCIFSVHLKTNKIKLVNFISYRRRIKIYSI
jgi:hypothetical protein